MKRRILEIGPGIRPMHYRSQEGLQLEEHEHYIGIDQSQKVFEHEAWSEIKKHYGDRVEVFTGDRGELMQITSDSIDELVALGTFGEPSKTLSEFKRVVRSGGLLLLGTSSEVATGDQFAKTWKSSLTDAGFIEVPEMEISYDYFPQPGSPERPYVVMAFRKNS
jgi:hypothetical protein